MSDLVLYEKQLREMIFASLHNNPDPDFIIDLLLLIPVNNNVDGAVCSNEDFAILKESFHADTIIDWRICSNVVFVIEMLRTGLRDLHIPLTKAKKWRRIRAKYTQLILDI